MMIDYALRDFKSFHQLVVYSPSWMIQSQGTGAGRGTDETLYILQVQVPVP